MTKGLVVSLAILTLSTSAALAAHPTHHRDTMNTLAHRDAMNAIAPVPTPQFGWTGGVSSSDHAMYLKNLRDSGYNPKNDFTAAGTMANQ